MGQTAELYAKRIEREKESEKDLQTEAVCLWASFYSVTFRFRCARAQRWHCFILGLSCCQKHTATVSPDTVASLYCDVTFPLLVTAISPPAKLGYYQFTRVCVCVPHIGLKGSNERHARDSF